MYTTSMVELSCVRWRMDTTRLQKESFSGKGRGLNGEKMLEVGKGSTRGRRASRHLFPSTLYCGVEHNFKVSISYSVRS